MLVFPKLWIIFQICGIWRFFIFDKHLIRNIIRNITHHLTKIVSQLLDNPQFWKNSSWTQRLGGKPFKGGKPLKPWQKKSQLRDTYKNYILQKKWVKTAHPALSSGQSNLQTPIWGHSRQLDDQHRNPNMKNKDYHVGQLTRGSKAVRKFSKKSSILEKRGFPYKELLDELKIYMYTIFFKPEVNSKLVVLAIQSCHLHVCLKSSN